MTILGRNAQPTSYRISALGKAAVVMWRGWSVFVPVLFAYAFIQALLSALPYSPENVGGNIASSLLSALVFFLTAAFVVVTAEAVPWGRATWTNALTQLKRHGAHFSLWLVIMVLVGAVGLALYTWPGIVIFAITPFVLVASVAGIKNPVKANFLTISKRFWRWLVTALIITALALLGYIILGFTEFFLRGILGASVIWTIVGFSAAWVFTAWALILANVQSGSTPPE